MRPSSILPIVYRQMENLSVSGSWIRSFKCGNVQMKEIQINATGIWSKSRFLAIWKSRSSFSQRWPLKIIIWLWLTKCNASSKLVWTNFNILIIILRTTGQQQKCYSCSSQTSESIQVRTPRATRDDTHQETGMWSLEWTWPKISFSQIVFRCSWFPSTKIWSSIRYSKTSKTRCKKSQPMRRTKSLLQKRLWTPNSWKSLKKKTKSWKSATWARSKSRWELAKERRSSGRFWSESVTILKSCWPMKETIASATTPRS